MVCGGECQDGGLCKRRTSDGKCYQHRKSAPRVLSSGSIMELSPQGDIEYPMFRGDSPAEPRLLFSRSRFSEGTTPKKAAKKQRKVQSAKKAKAKTAKVQISSTKRKLF